VTVTFSGLSRMRVWVREAWSSVSLSLSLSLLYHLNAPHDSRTRTVNLKKKKKIFCLQTHNARLYIMLYFTHHSSTYCLYSISAGSSIRTSLSFPFASLLLRCETKNYCCNIHTTTTTTTT
jgi:hypothetical protein